MLEDSATKAAILLKDLLKRLSRSGTSYSEISHLVGEREWSENSIKQFVHRDKVPRITPKLVLLAEIVVDRLSEVLGESSLTPFEYQLMSSLIARKDREYSFTELKEELSSRFSALKGKSPVAYLPPQVAFVRFGRPEGIERSNKMIIILVEIVQSGSGHFFTMKITGSQKRRRVVIGDVSFTLNNTYFSGIAYSVHELMTDEEFLELDTFDIKVLDRCSSRNEVGLEIFAISNSDMSYSVVPTSFCGLDGEGHPISGIGALISCEQFSKFNISGSVSSSVDCTGENKELFEALRLSSCKTLIHPKGGSYAIQEKLFERLDQSASKH